jgi:hypothetical protein
VRVLVDEQLNGLVATTWSSLVEDDDAAVHIYDLHAGGTDDADIPALCEHHGINVVFTMNVRDFGAKLTLYQALMAAGVSVVVARPKQNLDRGQQAALFLQHGARIRRLLDEADGPILISASASGVRERSLEELTAEITEKFLP